MINKIKFILYIGFLLVFFFQCTVKDPLLNETFSPWISNLSIPEVIYLQTEMDYPISVRVFDPQGLENIKLVQWSLFSIDGTDPILQDTLKDDGKAGDIIVRDGFYFGHLKSSFGENQTGFYIIQVMAYDEEGYESNGLVDTLEVVDSVKNSPPTLFQPSIPDTLTESNIISVTFSIKVSDPQGLQDIDSVFFQLYPVFNPAPLFSGRLLDNGMKSDVQAGDSIFSFWSNLYYMVRIGGDYLIRFQATDRSGERSRGLVLPLYVNRPNDPPVILEINAPDIVGLSEGHFTVTIHVEDPQGLEDIKMVYFNSTKPDGTPATGNPFFMYDDGLEKNGDLEEGDGWYSLEVEISRSNQPGNYQFTFYAEDQSRSCRDR